MMKKEQVNGRSSPAGHLAAKDLTADQVLKITEKENQRLENSFNNPLPATVEDYRQIYNPYKVTDLGNAERLEALAGDDLKYVNGIGWFHYDSGVWLPGKAEAREIFKEKVIPGIYSEIKQLAAKHDATGIKTLSGWAKRSEGVKVIDSALCMAESSRAFYIKPDKLDTNPMLLNVRNGVVDLETGRLLPHDRK